MPRGDLNIPGGFWINAIRSHTLVRMELSRPFIRLPYAFDADALAAEVAALPASAWMPHPSGMAGNSAVALISRDGTDNDDFDGEMRETPHLRACPYTRQVMASFGEVLGRSRLMRLAPGSEVSLHVDFNYHWYTRVRIHVPVVTEPEVVFHCADQAVHMAPGQCWIFDSWRRHRVVNGGRRDRVHLVIDTAGSSRFWRLVREMEAMDPRDERALEARLVNIGFDREAAPGIATERYNTAPVMAPGELDALVAEVLRDVEANPQNDPALVRRYRDLLVDFGKDWRENWHRYGYRREGWPRYRALIEALQQSLHPNPRALTMRSNELGANPVIVQRILRPALSPERLPQFLEPAAESNR